MEISEMNQTDFAAAVHVSFASSNGYVNAIFEERPDGTIHRHHDICLNDPRKVTQEKKGENHD